MSIRFESRQTFLAHSSAKSRWFLRWSAPLLLFGVGISALGYCGYVVLDARFAQSAQSRQFDAALLAAHTASAADLSALPAVTSDLAGTTPLMPAFSEGAGAAKSSSAIAAQNLPLGRIEIVSLGLTAMIEEGTGRQTLQRGIGHIAGTSLLGQSGNIGLAGHRDTFFRKLRNIHEGDEISLTTLAGSFVYRVDLISIVEPQDSAVLRDSGENLLTLVTCYPFSYVGPSPKRFIVRARQVPGAPAAVTTAVQ